MREFLGQLFNEHTAAWSWSILEFFYQHKNPVPHESQNLSEFEYILRKKIKILNGTYIYRFIFGFNICLL